MLYKKKFTKRKRSELSDTILYWARFDSICVLLVDEEAGQGQQSALGTQARRIRKKLKRTPAVTGNGPSLDTPPLTIPSVPGHNAQKENTERAIEGA